MRKKSNELNFKGQKIYVGIDSHLKSWVVTIMLEQSIYKTLSMNPSAEELSQYLEKTFPGGEYHSAYEAGFSGFHIHRELWKRGIRNFVVNPADIPTTDKEKKQKEDKRDSRKIAKSLRNGDLVGIYVPSIESMELRGLVRYRKTLVKEISRNKNRIKSFLYFNGINIPLQFQTYSGNWSGRFTSWLETIEGTTLYATEVISSLLKITGHLRKELLYLNRKLRGFMKEGEHAKLIKLLMSIPGVGFTTAVTILSEIDNIIRFKKIDHLCSYVGLVPSTNSSGEHERVGRISKRSNKPLRNIIIEAAWVATRNDPALAFSFHENCKRMKKNEAIVRTAKKLLSRIRYVMKNEVEYVYSVVQ